MIPSALTAQLERGIADFLRYSFWSSTSGMEHVIDDLIEMPGGVTKGPYLSVKLPFVKGKNPRFFPDIPLGFLPHDHQEKAFERLGGRRKQSTLVATGTGSGKTECFLLPILQHCLDDAATPGIKAILVYPMNALATDQAGRIARMIHENPKLRGRVTAGLYIGESKGKTRVADEKMGPSNVITDRETMEKKPPSILLTNYKMLDLMLIRPWVQGIWQHNQRGVFRYLVVDELHTFDGAQGTDLSCLIRRLKRRLQADDGSLCCVGTSATLGTGESQKQLLAYASQVFGEPFDEDAIIGESRVSADDLLFGTAAVYTDEPDMSDLSALMPNTYDEPDDWLKAQVGLWFEADWNTDAGKDWRVALGERLLEHASFRSLLGLLDNRTLSVDEILTAMSRARSAWRHQPALGRAAVISLMGLVSAAKRQEAGGRLSRFLDVRVQLWQREMSRMVATVAKRPKLAFSDDLDREQRQSRLPIIHCRDCGAMGWATKIDLDKPHLLRCNLTSFYSAFFRADPHVRFLYPAGAAPPGDSVWEQRPHMRIDSQGLVRLEPDDEPEGEPVDLVVCDNTRPTENGRKLHRDCPFCEARESLTLLGFRAATLTSTYIDQIFASRFNDDGVKKLLAFSDSVQDAAHRAGFFGARTWRTNLRVAIRRVIAETCEGLSLAEVSKQVTAYWQEKMDLPTWVATFIAPSMFWLHDWDEFQRESAPPEGSELMTLISRRLVFETAVEFGLQATIGRSLSRTHAAGVYLDPDKLEAASAALVEPLRNEVPGLRAVTIEQVRVFVLGMLHHLRMRGGILCDEIPGRFLETGGRDIFVFKQWVHLPAFGQKSRLPAFLTDRPGAARFDSWLSGGAHSEEWYERWVSRCFDMMGTLGPDAASLYPLVVYGLTAKGLLKAVDGTNRSKVYGVLDQALLATTDVAGLRCKSCGHTLSVASPEAPLWLQTPCLTGRCTGRYEPDGATRTGYFGRLYAHGDLQRIFTAEHTGLLTREEREEVERRFKAEAPKDPEEGTVEAGHSRRPWDPNLLSCTPTLEMGIDIGDLSSTLLCTVPPTQASYLQRIGRAGRRDGNSFVLALAAARPHDLYFYSEPEEMISGEVLPPGVYLDASAVLERQLAAFCFDRWVAKEGTKATVPWGLNDIFPYLGNTEKTEHFPYNLLWFIEREQPTILREFQEMFKGEVANTTVDHLKSYLFGGQEDEAGLRWRILDVFQREKRQLESLQGKARQVGAEIKKLEKNEAKPKDIEERIDKLEEEREALLALVGQIRSRNTLQFLTDEGMLPNYAFPESAVRLNSVIWRRKRRTSKRSGDKTSKYDTWTYEYTRSPSTALSELAPHADFYAGGRRVQIDQVDVTVSEIETWRFCDKCSHSQREKLSEPSQTCPACGSSTWIDDEQKLNLLPLRQVFANAPDRESRIRDDQDERRPRFYLTQVLVDHKDEDREGAWSIDEPTLPFGFEFLRKATFRDVNFGEHSDEGPSRTIAGREAVRRGFPICTRCGKVQPENGERVHALSCPAKTRGEAVPIEPALYLYREYSSEALRLLLPMADIGTSKQLHSFLAALQLGLKTRFGGSVDHLRTMVYSEPDLTSALRRQYLVLFDSVPGGTGYLKQLITPMEEDGKLPLRDVLEMAKERIETCSCWADPERDGCYRCLFGYRNARDMDDTSAKEAVQLIGRILSYWDKLAEVTSLSEVSVSGLMDSVLEARFIEALRQSSRGGRDNQVKHAIYKQKPGYHLTIGGLEWHIEPQHNLGVSDGFPIGISIDFILWPASDKLREKGRKPIAVLLDGFEYHKNQIGYDLLQRQLLLASGRFDVWSLTWYDLDLALGIRTRTPANLLHSDLGKLKQRFKQFGLVKWSDIADQSTFEWLLRDLDEVEPTPWEHLGKAVLASRMSPASPAETDNWQQRIQELAPKAARGSLEANQHQLLLSDEGELSPWVNLLASHDGKDVRFVASLDDTEDNWDAPEFLETWNGFLRLFQLLRQVENGWFVTKRSLDDTRWEHVSRLRQGPTDEGSWSTALDVDEPFKGIADELQAAGMPTPEVGMDIPDDKECAWAEAELVWEDRRIAITDLERRNEARGSASRDWHVFILEDLTSIDPVIQAFEKAKGGE